MSDEISINPLTDLTDDELLNGQLALALMCLRSKGALRRKHAVYGCALLRVLQLEGTRRRLDNREPPYRA